MTSNRLAYQLGVVTAALVILAGPLAMPAAASNRGAKHLVSATVTRFEHNGLAAQGLPLKHAVRVRACDRGVCAGHRFAPDPTCDLSAGPCIGTAARTRRLSNGVTVEAWYA